MEWCVASTKFRHKDWLSLHGEKLIKFQISKFRDILIVIS